MSGAQSEQYDILLGFGMSPNLAQFVDQMYTEGYLTPADTDEKVISALNENSEELSIQALTQFKNSDLASVKSKGAFLLGIIKRIKNEQGLNTASTNRPGPNPQRLQNILERTGYSHEVTPGQRKYGGPPPNWTGVKPKGTDVFVGKLPGDVFEDELIPLFENCGTIWDLRVMINPETGITKGFSFICFADKASAKKAVSIYNNYEIRPGKHITVTLTVPNTRLFIGSIPKNKSKQEILEAFSLLTEGITDVLVKDPLIPGPNKKNRGFCFLDYETHQKAAAAKRKLSGPRHPAIGPWNSYKVYTCEWADPMDDPDDEIMAKVKVLYITKLTETITEQMLRERFAQYGLIERVKKMKYYAFVHFSERECAIAAIEGENGKSIGNCAAMDVELAKPMSEDTRKKIKSIKEQRSQQYMEQNQYNSGYDASYGYDNSYGAPGGYDDGYSGGYQSFYDGGNQQRGGGAYNNPRGGYGGNRGGGYDARGGRGNFQQRGGNRGGRGGAPRGGNNYNASGGFKRQGAPADATYPKRGRYQGSSYQNTAMYNQGYQQGYQYSGGNDSQWSQDTFSGGQQW